MADDPLTAADAAAILKLNQQTVRNLIDRGSCPRFESDVRCGPDVSILGLAS
jgi:hypothetical protein